MESQKISLVIPVRNEADTVAILLESILGQTALPGEVVLVDGGSTDETVKIVRQIRSPDVAVRVITIENASPGKARNTGIAAAVNDWIALTDAGIRLEADWLEKLIAATEAADIVFGNFAPETDSFFEKAAALTYVAPQGPSGIRGKSVASCLLKKEVWEKVGGFPDLRASEDLAFIDAVKGAGFREAFAPDALVHWRLRPDIASTWQKFVEYSRHNVLAKRQWDWHYGVLRQYVLLVPFLLLAFFHSWWWLLAAPVWLFARTAVRLSRHRFEYGLTTILNPLIFISVAAFMVVIDAAMFLGWLTASRARQKA